jgi:hypothetical protein
MLLKKSLSTADQNFSRPLMRFSDKNVASPSVGAPGARSAIAELLSLSADLLCGDFG